MIDVVWDMETGDPDDFLTLLLLLGHPEVNLKAVTVTPGTPAQIGLVRKALSWFGRSIPVGAHNIDHQTPSAKEAKKAEETDKAKEGGAKDGSVSGWHYKAYGDAPHSRDAARGGEVLREVCDDATTLITGAPLKNLGAAMKLDGFRVGRVVVQGGFAGEGVVPRERQLAKFRGMTTCPTYNLNGDPRSALAMLGYAGIGTRRFVSKNVCHGVVYDEAWHTRVGVLKDASRSLGLIWQGMDYYLQKSPEGKKLHDPLAACCAINESIGTWAEVEIYREKGLWGSRLSPGSNTWIITDYDRERFIQTFTAH
jgi:inosine-uridine nucleoside N-ribohydrolase